MNVTSALHAHQSKYSGFVDIRETWDNEPSLHPVREGIPPWESAKENLLGVVQENKEKSHGQDV